MKKMKKSRKFSRSINKAEKSFLNLFVDVDGRKKSSEYQNNGRRAE
jgi:hypothetical protein